MAFRERCPYCGEGADSQESASSSAESAASADEDDGVSEDHILDCGPG